MKPVVRMKFGSHLYGTDTPASDTDFKSVFIPDARDIVLQRVKGSIQNKRPKAMGEKNHAGDVDEESFSLQRYLGLLVEGQTVALDMLFAPPAMWLQSTDVWRDIVANRHRLLTRKSSSFVGYCRQQANKYGIKGSRVAAARDALELIDGLIFDTAPHARVREYLGTLTDFCHGRPHCEMVTLPVSRHDARELDHFEVCGRKIPETVTLKQARDMLATLYEGYGHRSRLAEQNEGVDWKALSHAVRVGYEALELMTTGEITFPLLNRSHVLDIKLGKVQYSTVASEIEELLSQVEATEKTSVLPEHADLEWIDDFVLWHYGSTVTWR